VDSEKQFNGEELRECRKRHRLTQEEFARVLDIDRTYLARLETGEKTPSSKLQSHIENTIAEMHSNPVPLVTPRNIPSVALPARLRAREIPVVSWAAAGKARDYQDLATQIDETVGTHVADPNAFAVIVEGDSMEPEYRAGDRVIVAPNLEARTGDVVLVKLKDGRVMVKKFHRTGPNGATIRLLSENLNYETLEFSGEQIQFVYPVMEFKRFVRR
jgi:SOS-response transcriptional repressor LexA